MPSYSRGDVHTSQIVTRRHQQDMLNRAAHEVNSASYSFGFLRENESEPDRGVVDYRNEAVNSRRTSWSMPSSPARKFRFFTSLTRYCAKIA